MKEFSENYRSKIEACKSAVEQLGADLQEILDKYDGQTFPNSQQSKGEMFSNVLLRASLSDDEHDFLEQHCNLAHHKDNRTPQEYGADLIMGWVVEDAVLAAIEQKGHFPILSGHDRYREFLTPKQISTQADIEVDIRGTRKTIEVFADWKQTWAKQNHADLRDNKYEALVAKQAILFGISPLDSKGFVLRFPESKDLFERVFNPAYHKMSYRCSSVKEHLISLDKAFEELIN